MFYASYIFFYDCTQSVFQIYEYITDHFLRYTPHRSSDYSFNLLQFWFEYFLTNLNLYIYVVILRVSKVSFRIQK